MGLLRIIAMPRVEENAAGAVRILGLLCNLIGRAVWFPKGTLLAAAILVQHRAMLNILGIIHKSAIHGFFNFCKLRKKETNFSPEPVYQMFNVVLLRSENVVIWLLLPSPYHYRIKVVEICNRLLLFYTSTRYVKTTRLPTINHRNSTPT